MKTKLFILAIAAFAFVGTTANAQSAEESVKLLRSSKSGIIKLHYALPISEPLVVTFVNQNGIVASDRIEGIYPHGLSKKYDFSNISDSQFHIELSTAQQSLRYLVTPSKNGRTFTATLEKSTYNQAIVKRNN